MKNIKHKFKDHKIRKTTELLIVGTFNPDAEGNDADFFYGRSRNYLWRLLPTVFNDPDLKGASVKAKKDFCKDHNIDFIDLIEEINVAKGHETNYSDNYIDSKVIKWKDITGVIKSLPKLKKVCFTRKTFSGIPHMKKQIEEVREQCKINRIMFQPLVSPARFYNKKKQKEWTDFFNLEYSK